MLQIDTFIHMLEPIGLGLMLVVAYGSLCRALDSDARVHMAMGVLFGCASMIAMVVPVDVADGIILDLRGVFIVVSAAFFGWRAALITTAIAIATRLNIGGAGAIAGVAQITISAMVGLGWARWIAPRFTRPLVAVALLGAILSTNLASALFLPATDAIYFLINFGPLVAVLNLAATSALALMVLREQNIVGHEGLLMRAATIDPLTKALNRKTVAECYQKMRRTNTPQRGVAVICIDVDHFKQANDTHGHLVGDQVLVSITERMELCLRPSDLFARMSGDEFLIVLNNVSRSEVEIIAERCRFSVSGTPIRCGVVDVPITVSLGSSWAETNHDFDKQRHAADAALYLAKKKGRNRIALDGALIVPQAA